MGTFVFPPIKTKAKKEGEQREEKPSKLDPEGRLNLLSREILFLETAGVYWVPQGARDPDGCSRFSSIVLRGQGTEAQNPRVGVPWRESWDYFPALYLRDQGSSHGGQGAQHQP